MQQTRILKLTRHSLALLLIAVGGMCSKPKGQFRGKTESCNEKWLSEVSQELIIVINGAVEYLIDYLVSQCYTCLQHRLTMQNVNNNSRFHYYNVNSYSCQYNDYFHYWFVDDLVHIVIIVISLVISRHSITLRVP